MLKTPILALAALLICSPAVDADTSVPLFENHDLLEVTLTAEFPAIFRERDQTKSKYHPATLSYTDDSGNPVTLPVNIKTRGQFRLQRENCRYPLLFWGFDTGDVTETIFAGQDVLPVITHCQSSRRYEQYLLQEYLAYRLFQTLTERSFHLRLMQIKYVNKKKLRTKGTFYAFAVENWDALAERLGATRIEPEKFNPLNGDPFDTVLMNVFQYMIGNTDWSAVYGHNIVLLEDVDSGSITPLPFDLDSSGVVDPLYATPGENLPIRSVRQRLYRGLCRPDEHYFPVFDRFRERRTLVYDLYRQQDGLRNRERDRTLRYFDLFYEIIDSSEESRRQIIGRCRRFVP